MVSTCTMSIAQPHFAVETERVHPVSNDISSTTAVGLYLGGVVTGALGVLLIVGIVCGTCRLRKIKHK